MMYDDDGDDGDDAGIWLIQRKALERYKLIDKHL